MNEEIHTFFTYQIDVNSFCLKAKKKIKKNHVFVFEFL